MRKDSGTGSLSHRRRLRGKMALNWGGAKTTQPDFNYQERCWRTAREVLTKRDISSIGVKEEGQMEKREHDRPFHVAEGEHHPVIRRRKNSQCFRGTEGRGS